MHKVNLGPKIVRDFPENIFELNTEQWHYYVQLYLMIQRGHINLMEAKVMLVYHFLDLLYTGKPSNDKNDNLALLIELLDGFYEVVPGGKGVRPVIFCPVNLAKQFTHEGQKFTGPADALADATLKQFLDGLTYLNAFNKSQDNVYLVQLFSTFHNVDVAVAEKLPEYILFGFYFFFRSSVDFITTNNISMGNGQEYDFSPLFQSSESDSKGVGPIGILFTLAETGVFGDDEKTEKLNLYKALTYLLKSHQDAEEAKRKFKEK